MRIFCGRIRDFDPIISSKICVTNDDKPSLFSVTDLLTGIYYVLGFEFDYNLDLSYDNIKPDLDRLIAIFGLIQSLQSMDTMEIFENTRGSCLHNKEHVLSGKFYSISEKINQETVQYIYNNI
jgi:hypothetical protein